ncbi:MAG TPA: VOC family protein [Caulobacteraceae bacterium]|nr:VOC family protein [Caulobacteraceae bacterium]
MLAEERLVAFLGTSDATRARAFYEGVLGLTCVDDHEFLITFDCGPARVALQKLDSPVTPPHGTALGWHVNDLTSVMKALMSRGVVFERFEALDQDEMGVWRPGGPTTGVAWFKDPDGNLLSLSSAG